MSGLAKSSSRRPQARSMERAPARLAPSIKAWLRGLDAGSVTDKSPRAVALRPTIIDRKFRTFVNGDAKHAYRQERYRMQPFEQSVKLILMPRPIKQAYSARRAKSISPEAMGISYSGRPAVGRQRFDNLLMGVQHT